MKVQDALNRIYNLLPRLIQRRDLIKEIAWDLDRHARGTVPYFPLDFYEIHSFLFPLEGGGRDVEFVNYYFEHLPHKMILLPPTALEFIRYLERNYIDLGQMADSSSYWIDQFLASPELKNFREKLEVGQVSEIMQAYRQLPLRYQSIIDMLRKDAVQKRLEEPPQTFMRYLDTERLVDLDQIVGNGKLDFDEDIFTTALRAFQEYRPERYIPNRTDALNLAITFRLNDTYYKASTGGSLFSIVTHGSDTLRVYSDIRWHNDPLPRNQLGTRLNRDHRYCAYRAFFEMNGNPRKDIAEYLKILDEIQVIQDQFEGLYQKWGRNYLHSLEATDSQEVIEINEICLSLNVIEENIKKIDLEAKITSEALAWDDAEVTHLKEKLAGRNKIMEVLGEQLQAVKLAIKDVFERLEPMLRSRAVEIVDRDGYKEATILVESLSKTFNIQFESFDRKEFSRRAKRDEEKIVVKAFVGEIHKKQRPLEVEKPYMLNVEIEWHKTKTADELIEYPLDVLIWGKEIKVTPNQIERLIIKPGNGPVLQQFNLVFTNSGDQEVIVEVLHKRNNWCRIPLKIRVLSDKEPLYNDNIGWKTSSLRSIPPLPRLYEQPQIHMTTNRSKGSKYEILITCDRGPVKFDINMTQNDISIHNHDIQEAAQRLAEASLSIDGYENSQEVELAKKALAREGKLLYKRLFSEETIGKIKGIFNEGSIVQIFSDELLLPWDLIYDGDPDVINIGDFWGMQYMICRRLIDGSQQTSPEIKVEKIPEVGLITDISLEAVESIEIPFFGDLHSAQKINLNHLEPLASDAEDSVKKFILFLKNNFHLAHFACHAIVCEDKSKSSYLTITDGCQIRVKDLIIYDLKLNAHPLVILNACHTGIVDPRYTLDFVRTFLEKGALGVVATECAIPDVFAAKFTQRLYRHFLSGKPLGWSLVRTRWDMRGKSDNPLGLFYGLYAPSGTRLTKTVVDYQFS